MKRKSRRPGSRWSDAGTSWCSSSPTVLRRGSCGKRWRISEGMTDPPRRPCISHWSAHWSALPAGGAFSLQIPSSARRFLNRVRKFDSCRGHSYALHAGTADGGGRRTPPVAPPSVRIAYRRPGLRLNARLHRVARLPPVAAECGPQVSAERHVLGGVNTEPGCPKCPRPWGEGVAGDGALFPVAAQRESRRGPVSVRIRKRRPPAGDVLVSSTLKDLLAGSRIDFVERGASAARSAAAPASEGPSMAAARRCGRVPDRFCVRKSNSAARSPV